MKSRINATGERFYGVYEAIVTSVKDESRQGRITVKFPWYDDRTEFECRVRQLYAGKDFGAFFIPEPKTEVLVAFIQGDMRFPVVLGGLYNGKDKPPTFRDDDKKDEKMIRTKGGHQIILDDTKGSEKIVIVDKSGNNSLVIDSNGDSITITAKSGKLTLNAKGGIDIKSDAGINVEASATLTLKGSTINLN